MSMVQPTSEALTNQPTVESVYLCEVGLFRSNNEDSIAVVNCRDQGKGTLLVVADGMGGMEGGERASTLVTSELPSLYLSSIADSPAQALVSAVLELNRRVYDAGLNSLSGKAMGTTVVAALILGNTVVTVNVGDSRAYLLHDGKIRQLTVDHTLRRAFFAPFSSQPQPFAHVLTQALGPEPVVTPEVAVSRMNDNDLLVLCSDGLTSALSDYEIEKIITSVPFETSAQALRDEVYRKSGDDNISIIISRIGR